MKRMILILLAVALVVGGGYLAYRATQNDDPETIGNTTTQEAVAPEPESTPVVDTPPQSFDFAQAKKSAHYVSNAPANEAILSSPPAEVTINFNFDLASNSTISVKKDGQEVSTGSIRISADKQTLSKSVNATGGSGLYTVSYNACWPDGSCHDGQFQFGVK